MALETAPQITPKQLEWETLAEKFARITDGLGMPIDPAIRDTIIALNALGIPTTMSCGGHLNDKRGLRLPWIDIEAKDPTIQEIRKEAYRLNRKADALRLKFRQLAKKKEPGSKAARKMRERMNKAYKKMHRAYGQGRLLQCDVRNKLIQYLTQFYEGRDVPLDRRLVLWVSPAGISSTRLYNQGSADFYINAQLEVQQQKLFEYREEIKAFTDFLKGIFFAEEAATAS